MNLHVQILISTANLDFSGYLKVGKENDCLQLGIKKEKHCLQQGKKGKNKSVSI